MATSVVAPPPAPAPAAPAPAAPAPSTGAETLGDLVRASIVPLNTEATPPADGGTPPAPPAPDVTAPDGQQAPAPDLMVLPDDAVAPPPAAAAPATPDPNAPTPEDAPLDFTGESLEPDSVDADGKRMFTTPTKWAKFQNAAKFVNALQEVMPQVTPSTVIDAVRRASAADALMTKYQAGASNAAEVNDVLDLFTGEVEVNGVKQQPTPIERQAFGALVLNALDRLQRINPQAMQGVYRVHNQQTVEGLRARARALPEGDAKAQAVALALRFEEAAFGRFTPRDQWLQTQPTDPIEQQRQAIARERQTLDQQRQQWQQQQHQELVTNIGNAQENARQAPIVELLSKLKGPVADEFRPQMYDEFLRGVAEHELAHPEWGHRQKTLEQQAIMDPSPQNIQALNDFRRSISKPVVDRMARDVIAKYNARAIERNQADKDRALRPIVNTPSPNGVPTPAPNGAMESVMKQPSLKDALRETMRLSSAGVRL